MVHLPGAWPHGPPGRPSLPGAKAMAAALTLAHIDGGWEESVRRPYCRSPTAHWTGPSMPRWWPWRARVTRRTPLRRSCVCSAACVRTRRPMARSSYYPTLLWCTLRLPELPDEDRDDARIGCGRARCPQGGAVLPRASPTSRRATRMPSRADRVPALHPQRGRLARGLAEAVAGTAGHRGLHAGAQASAGDRRGITWAGGEAVT